MSWIVADRLWPRLCLQFHNWLDAVSSLQTFSSCGQPCQDTILLDQTVLLKPWQCDKHLDFSIWHWRVKNVVLGCCLVASSKDSFPLPHSAANYMRIECIKQFSSIVWYWQVPQIAAQKCIGTLGGPSVWGWKLVEKWNSDSNKLDRCLHNAPVKQGLQSLMMCFGTPQCFTTSLLTLNFDRPLHHSNCYLIK